MKKLLRINKGTLEVHAVFEKSNIKALGSVFYDGKLIKQKSTPFLIKLKPGSYTVKVEYMSQIAEKDVEIKSNEKVMIEFKFPTGTLECRAFEGTKEVKALVEIINEEGKVVARRVTPFLIHLESGSYSLKATYSPEKKQA